MAKELVDHPEFTAVEKNLEQLLIILSTDPEQFIDLISRMLEQNPDNAWLRAIRDDLMPSHSPSVLDQVLLELDRPPIVANTKAPKLNRLKDKLKSNPQFLADAFTEFSTILLQSEGLVDEEEREDLLRQLIGEHHA